MVALELVENIVGAVFVNIENNKSLGVMCRNLSAKLTTDRATAAGYHYDLVFNVSADLINVNLDALSAEEVGGDIPTGCGEIYTFRG